MDVGGVHTRFEQATFRVDQNVAFATRDLLSAVVAARTAGLGGADGLAVDDGCRRLRLAAGGEAVLLTQRRVDPLPGAVPTPLGIVVEHCCPGRKVVRQGAPLTSGAEQVEHGLDDAAQCEDLWMSRLLSRTKRKRRGSITLSLARRGANIRPLIAGGGIWRDCRRPYDQSYGRSIRLPARRAASKSGCWMASLD